LIFFGPHQDGVAEVLADDEVATTNTAIPRSARSAPPLLVLIVVYLPSLRGLSNVLGEQLVLGRRDARHATPPETTCERPPIDAVERDSHGERPRLHERTGRVRHAKRKHELVELG